MTTTIDVLTQRTDDSPIDADVVQAADGTTALVSTDEVADTALTAEELQAEREAEYYTIVWADPANLHIGPNVRTENAVPDEDKVRDIKKRGVQSPIKGYRDEAGNLVITVGQLRALGAVQAGRETVPVWVQPPPSEDEKEAAIARIVDQVNENDLRTPMTRGDIYRAHQQLEAFGLSVTAIARRLSRRKKVVENSMKVGGSELAAKAADKYALNLEQAAVIAEFENYGDLDTAKELILTAVENPNNFTALAQRKRNDRAETERMRVLTETLIADLITAGVPILDSTVPDWTGTARSLDKLRATPDTEPGTELTAEAHADCPGHAAWITYEYDETDRKIPVADYGCIDFRTHGHALGACPAGQVEYDRTGTGASCGSTDDATATAAIELARQQGLIINRWVRENNLNWDAAVEARITWLAAFARRQTAPKGAQVFLAIQKATGSHDLRRAMERSHPLAHRLLKLDQPDYGTSGELVERIGKATPAKATVYDVFLTLAAMEERLQRNAWRTPTGSEAHYLFTIIGWGHKASDVELKVLNPEREQDVIAAALGISEDSEETTEPGVDIDDTDEGDADEGDRPGQDDGSPTDIVADDAEAPGAGQDAEVDEHVDSADDPDLTEFADALS